MKAVLLSVRASGLANLASPCVDRLEAEEERDALRVDDARHQAIVAELKRCLQREKDGG